MHTILVVDDDPTCREIHRRLLPRAGFAVVIATNGLDALEALKTHPPDLILLDLAMPQMDGLTFLKLLRENPKYKDLPVFLITALASRETVRIAGSLGVRDYFVKAEFTMESLYDRIRKYLPPEGENPEQPSDATDDASDPDAGPPACSPLTPIPPPAAPISDAA